MYLDLETRRRGLSRTWSGRAFLLLLLFALPALAQPGQAPVLGPDLAPLPPPLVTTGVPTPDDGGSSAPARRPAVVRVGAELGGSLVGAVALGVAGAVGAGLLSLAMCGSDDGTVLGLLGMSTECFASSAFVGGAAGLAVGIPLGAGAVIPVVRALATPNLPH